jgi:RimJ/RimL family protein N-acetyltransferase
MDPRTTKPCSKQSLLAALPRTDADLRLRALTREDLDTLADWPSFPPGYEAFNHRFAGMTSSQRDDLFDARRTNPARITLVADHNDQSCIAYLGLIDIDWSRRLIGNMGYRIHPYWCDRGIGTHVMSMTAAWCLEGGIEMLRLDVAGANPRAIRCYEKAGFARVGEFWREDPNLKDVDLSQPQYDSLRPHVRRDGAMPYVRFYWMQLARTALPKD